MVTRINIPDFDLVPTTLEWWMYTSFRRGYKTNYNTILKGLENAKFKILRAFFWKMNIVKPVKFHAFGVDFTRFFQNAHSGTDCQILKIIHAFSNISYHHFSYPNSLCKSFIIVIYLPC